MEILDCDGKDKFILAPIMETLLVEDNNPFYFGHMARFTVRHWSKSLEKYPEYYREGHSEFYKDFELNFSQDAKALSDQGVPSAYIFIIISSIPDLKSDLYTGIKILDVGCGSGLLMIQLAKAFPNCSFVGIDVVSFAIEDAQQNIEDNSVGDRVSA